MGYNRCSAPGCSSRTGQGIIFRMLPKNGTLVSMWVKQFPPGHKLTHNSALCEKHFLPSDFEKVRQDGKKRLKDFAVPQPLTDIGINCCAVPLCNSATNCGLMFKAFPTDKSLAKKWLKLLPRKFIFKSSTTFCELHFEEDQYETLQDGERRLKDSAVPVLLEPPQSALQDPADLIPDSKSPRDVPNPHLWTRRERSPESLGDHSYFTSHFLDQCEGNQAVNQNMKKELIQNPSPSIEATSILKCETLPSSHDDPSEELALEPMEYITNDFEDIQDTSSNSKLASNTLKNAIHQTDSEVERDTSSNILASKSNSSSHITHQTYNEAVKASSSCSLASTSAKVGIVDINKVNVILSNMSAEVERRRKQCEEKDKRFYELQRKYDTLRVAHMRLKKKAKVTNHPQWLHKSQFEVIRRGTSRGAKWDPELIREGLILKDLCGNTGYEALVKRLPLFPSVRKLQGFTHALKQKGGSIEDFDWTKYSDLFDEKSNSSNEISSDEMETEPDDDAPEQLC